jgi:hypothetical protein
LPPFGFNAMMAAIPFMKPFVGLFIICLGFFPLRQSPKIIKSKIPSRTEMAPGFCAGILTWMQMYLLPLFETRPVCKPTAPLPRLNVILALWVWIGLYPQAKGFSTTTG